MTPVFFQQGLMEIAIREFLEARRRWEAADGVDTRCLEALLEAEKRLAAAFFSGWEVEISRMGIAYFAFRKALVRASSKHAA